MANFERPLLTSSIYRHALAVRTDEGAIIFELPERLPFEDRDDTIVHIANGQEYLWDLAQRYYSNTRAQAFDLWDVIAQFQPEPIVDSSVPLPEGKEILIPSIDYIEEVVSGPSLASTPEL